MSSSLINKYNVPGPRYTSYPTVPYWEYDGFTGEEWERHMKLSFNSENNNGGISLYIHLPFCESLCTFCGCNKRITKNHNVEEKYINALLQEWQMYLKIFGTEPVIGEIHLGGGTPTFFNPQNLQHLLNGILKNSKIHNTYEFGFEGHPNNTQEDHLKVLYDLGFTRCSYGVQDYDPIVQKTINRIQPFDNVKRITELSRKIGFKSISHDLVFGLPHQKLSSIENTINKTAELSPDRIAFYSYAHVPWIKGVGQRGFSEEDLPKNDEKRLLYEKGRELLELNEYFEIGMDHFSKTHDQLYKTFKSGTLHRNFMGYTTSGSKLMIGLGVSAIGDTWSAFAQNEKGLEDYYQRIDKNELPIFRGHILNNEDLKIRAKILDLMCRFETNIEDLPPDIKTGILERLEELLEDNLIKLSGSQIKILEKGLPFIRNICMSFDLRLYRNKPSTQLFSMTI
ncbi:oxygen-independent coproporphyrinogen III oxidase [Hyphobacterium sp. CCMP332]|nr:oxygen-independent coproporphyrinogen III oxidase [Hyphobacterium sp. CCMP332]